jgi:hypothetical protein
MNEYEEKSTNQLLNVTCVFNGEMRENVHLSYPRLINLFRHMLSLNDGRGFSLMEFH